MDKFNLKDPTEAFQFFFELHNLPSALPRDAQITDAATKLGNLLHNVRAAKMGGFTSRKTGKRDAGDAKLDDSNAPPAPENTMWGGSNRSLARGLSKLGIQLTDEEECPGWTPLNPVRSFTFVGYLGINPGDYSYRRTSAVGEHWMAILLCSSLSNRVSVKSIHSSAASSQGTTTRSPFFMKSHSRRTS